MPQLWRIPLSWRRRLPFSGIAKGVVVRGRGMEERKEGIAFQLRRWRVRGRGSKGPFFPPWHDSPVVVLFILSLRRREEIISELLEKYSTIRALARIIESNYGHLWGGGRHSPRQPKGGTGERWKSIKLPNFLGGESIE